MFINLGESPGGFDSAIRLNGRRLTCGPEALHALRKRVIESKIALCAAFLTYLLFPLTSAGGASCEGLRNLGLPNTAITLAQVVGAGTFQLPKHPWPPPQSSASFAAYDKLPGFCRVTAVIKPSKDSHVNFEVWMPLSGWNGKFQGTGNGLWSGEIYYWAMGQALAAGYATANTDTGHEGPSDDASFALGHPEKVIDFGYRAVHEMTVKAKSIIRAFYGAAPRFSYWNGCSGGGRQSLKEAQRFPLDYDGIVAGAPGNYWTHMTVPDVQRIDGSRQQSPAYIPPEKYEFIHKAVLDACDGLDGVKDGVLEDPMRCHFDPKVLECKDPNRPECLTAAQVDAVKKSYAGKINPRTGESIYPGSEPGSELGWRAFQLRLNQAAGSQRPTPGDHFKYLVFKNPSWDFRTFNYDTDVALADKLDNNTINAIDPDLTPFVRHGGKLLLYHGWNDSIVPPRNTINYYQNVLSATRGEANLERSVRLFMAPGMEHCGGGEGPNNFDEVEVIAQWVENGRAPERIVASRRNGGKVDRTRPLCPYPQIATYKGTGSTDDAANFVCTTEK